MPHILPLFAAMNISWNILLEVRRRGEAAVPHFTTN